MRNRKPSPRRVSGKQIIKAFTRTAVVGLGCTALALGLDPVLALGHTEAASPVEQVLPADQVLTDSNLFRPTHSDLGWAASLTNDVRSFLTLTGAGTTRQADQIDNNPEHALNEAGMRPLVSNDAGVALWSNCSPITVSIHLSELLNDTPAAKKATLEAVSQLAILTGLDLRVETDSIQTVRFNDLDSLPPAGSREIQLIWVTEGSESLEDHLLGETELHFSEAQLELRSATVILSDEIIGQVADRQHWTGDSAVLSVLHELGHSVGLGHSLDPHSMMAPSLADEAEVTLADRSALAYAGTRQCRLTSLSDRVETQS